MKITKLAAVVVFLAGATGAFAAVYPAVEALSGTTCTEGWYGACRDGCSRLHKGVDITNSASHAAIGASAPGVVSFRGWNAGYGQAVQVDHGNRYSTYYAHLHAINVSLNQMVGNGTTVGTEGGSGYNNLYYYGEHLHWEVRFDNVQQPVWPDYNPGGCVSHTKGQNHQKEFFNWHYQWWGKMKFCNFAAVKNLDNPGGSMSAGTQMIVWDDNGNPAQHWNVDLYSGGWTRMRNAQSGLTLDLASGSNANGTKVQQWHDNGQTPQRWMIERQNGSWDGFRLRNQASGTVIKTTGTAGGSLQVGWGWDGENTQQWWVNKL